MRQLAIVSLLAFMTIVSCAKDKDKKTQLTFSTDPLNANTLTGYFNPSSQTPIEVGGVFYRISSQTNTQIIYQAQQQARLNQIPPVYVNGVPKYNANITGFVNDIQYSGNQNVNQYGNPYNNQYTQQVNTLTVTAIQFY